MQVAHIGVLLGVVGCTAPGTDAEAVARDLRDFLRARLSDLPAEAVVLQGLAPQQQWQQSTNPVDVDNMRQSWKRQRDAWRQSESVVRVLQPEVAEAVALTYDEAMRGLAEESNPFDGVGFVGLHAVERILWGPTYFAPAQTGGEPPESAIFLFEEAEVPGYFEPTYPAVGVQSTEFKFQLVERLIEDLRAPSATGAVEGISADAGWWVLRDAVALLDARVRPNGIGADTSRYSQSSLVDLREGLAGARTLMRVLRPWVDGAPNGAGVGAEIDAGFDRVQAALDGTPGDAMPLIPEAWAVPPTPTDAATDYGQLWTAITTESNVDDPASLAAAIERAVVAVGAAEPDTDVDSDSDDTEAR